MENYLRGIENKLAVQNMLLAQQAWDGHLGSHHSVSRDCGICQFYAKTIHDYCYKGMSEEEVRRATRGFYDR